MKRTPIKDRVRAAFDGEVRLDYWELMRRVFPPKDYPRAYRYQQNGGPPGCCMAFGKALRELDCYIDYQKYSRLVYRPKRITS